MSYCEFSELKGKTFTSISPAKAEDDAIGFYMADGSYYLMYHDQSCCESVYIESIVGDLQDLVGEPILLAEEVCNEDGAKPAGWEPDKYCDSYTWTFYKLATRKGYVDIRWFGTSNGWYSESVGIKLIKA